MTLADKLKNDLEYVALAGRVPYVVEFSKDGDDTDEYNSNWDRRHVKATAATKAQANCWSSECRMLPGWHMPVFDVDVPRDKTVPAPLPIIPGQSAAVEHVVEFWIAHMYHRYVPVRWVPSTTEGHHHVYVDWPIEWEKYALMLGHLYNSGVIERGYWNASEARKMSFVRMPHVKRPPRKPVMAPSYQDDEPFLLGYSRNSLQILHERFQGILSRLD